MDVDSVITEFVDDDGEDVALGGKGEIIFTSLFNFAMPLIRYAVGDVGIPSDDERPCVRNLPLMEVIEAIGIPFWFCLMGVCFHQWLLGTR